MGLFEKYQFPLMYTSPELNAAIDKLVAAARRNSKILGLFLLCVSATSGEPRCSCLN